MTDMNDFFKRAYKDVAALALLDMDETKPMGEAFVEYSARREALLQRLSEIDQAVEDAVRSEGEADPTRKE